MLGQFCQSISSFIKMFYSRHWKAILLAIFLVILLILAIIGFVQMIQALQFMSKYTCKTQVKDFLLILSLLNWVVNILAFYLFIRFVRSTKNAGVSRCQRLVNFLFQNKVSYLYISLCIFQIIWIIQSINEIANEPLKSTCRRPIFVEAFSTNWTFSVYTMVYDLIFFLLILLRSYQQIECLFYLKNLCFYISCSYYFKLECKIEPPPSQYQIAQQIVQPAEEQNLQNQQLPVNTNADARQPIVNQPLGESHIPVQGLSMPNQQIIQNAVQRHVELEFQLLSLNNEQGR